ncbi:hypothetical protein B7P43_G16663, partial [Cryptotermes secundus]
TKYMLLSRHQNVGQIHNTKIGNRCFENVVQFRYLETTITNQNLIQEEIKRRLNSGNACYHSVQNLLSSRMLSKNIKIRIYKTNFSAVLYGEIRWDDMDWIYLAKDKVQWTALLNTVMNLRVP